MNVNDIIITKHAIERFRERCPTPSLKNHGNTEWVIKMLLAKAIPIRFSKEHMVKRLLSNSMEYADYFYSEGYIFVCSENKPKTLITVEFQEGRQFGVDFFRLDTH